MKFADFMCNKSLNANLQATTKAGAIREMVEALVKAGQLPEENLEDIVRCVLKREELGSTGIGRCVAVPHTRYDVKKMVGTVGISPNGVDFDSLDGQPVRVLFMLISPPEPHEPPSEHLAALEHIAKQLREDTFRRFMMQAKNQADIIELLSEADANQFTA